MEKLLYKEESYIIQGGAFEVYKKFRDRHKEVIYLRSLIVYLEKNGLKIEKEKQIPVYFEDKKVGTYVPDMIVNSKILVELKAKPRITNQDIGQFWGYLKSTNYRLGYLINFGAPKGVEIIRRVYDTARKK